MENKKIFEIKIRKMKENDLNMLFALGKKQWINASWFTKEYLRNSFKNKGFNYVATIDEKIVGGLLMVFEDIVKNWIRYLIVDKKYRDMGIGSALVLKVIKNLKRGESIFVDTGLTDKRTINFYEKIGFKKRGTVKSLYGNKSACFLEKNID